MAYASARDVAVLFGGYDGSSHFNDTWEWTGSSWTQQPVSGPSAREDHAVAYLACGSTSGVVVLFGGRQGSQWFDDTWHYSLAQEDCNGNGAPDDCDIAFGDSRDCNGNGVPDDCDCSLADLNCDGVVNVTDFTIFAKFYGQSCTPDP